MRCSRPQHTYIIATIHHCNNMFAEPGPIVLLWITGMIVHKGRQYGVSVFQAHQHWGSCKGPTISISVILHDSKLIWKRTNLNQVHGQIASTRTTWILCLLVFCVCLGNTWKQDKIKLKTTSLCLCCFLLQNWVHKQIDLLGTVMQRVELVMDSPKPKPKLAWLSWRRKNKKTHQQCLDCPYH